MCKTIQNTKTHCFENKVLDSFGAFIVEIRCTIRLNKVQYCRNCSYCAYALSLSSFLLTSTFRRLTLTEIDFCVINFPLGLFSQLPLLYVSLVLNVFKLVEEQIKAK